MLSFVTPLTALSSAAETVADSVTDRVTKSLSFAAVLGGNDVSSKAPAQEQLAPDQLRETLAQRQAELAEAVSQRLASQGIDSGGMLELEFDDDGDFHLPPGHAAAGRIELLLNSDDALRRQAADLHSLFGEVDRLEFAQRAERLREIDPRAAAELRFKASDLKSHSRKLTV